MPSYPIRPTFPIDVRSTPSVKVTRTGTAFSFDLDPIGALQNFKPSRNQFFTALDLAFPGATSTIAAAIPSDTGDAINRAYTGSLLITQTGVLAQFVKATLGLTDAQLSSVITAARLVTE